MLEHTLKEKLPQYMHPKLIMILDEFPLTQNKKVNYKKLPPPSVQEMNEDNFVPPTSKLEKEIEEVWMNVLGVSQISTKSNFFSIGGHSLNAMNVRNKLSERLNIQLTIGALFEYPTIDSLSHYISTLEDNQLKPIIKSEIKSAMDHIPFSEEQKSLWFIQKLYPHLPMYNISFPFIVNFPFDKHLIKKAFQILLERHFTLNSIIVDHGTENILKLYQGPLPYKESQAILDDHVIVEEVHIPFDLRNEPPVRLLCQDLRSGSTLLQFTFHHFGVDRASFPLFFKEFNEQVNQDSAATTQDIQYVEYAKWQQSKDFQIKEEQSIAFWKEYLEDAPSNKMLTDQQRPENPSFKGLKSTFPLSPSLTNSIKEFAKNEQVTPFITFLGIFLSLLHRYINENDIVIGIPISTRTRQEFEQIIGCFVNTIPLRMYIDQKSTFLGIIESLKNIFPKLLENGQLPFHKLIQHLNLNRHSNSHPLFQILFVFEELQSSDLLISNQRIKNLDFNTHFAHFDIVFAVKDKGSIFEIEVQYATDLYSKDTIDKLCTNFIHLAHKLITSPSKFVSHHDVLENQEREEILIKCNGKTVPYPKICIHRFFENIVHLQPHTLALVYEDEAISYAALNEKANQLAHYLIQQGVQLESFVGICMDRSIDQIIVLLAVLKIWGLFYPS